MVKGVKVKYDIHAYAEAELCDFHFDPPYYGLHGPKCMRPPADKRGCTFEFEYDEKTAVSDFVYAVKRDIWGDEGLYYVPPTRFGFLIEGNRFYIDNDSELPIQVIFDKYFSDAKTIMLQILISCNAGNALIEDGFRFYMHSHEGNQEKEPHVIVEDAQKSFCASVRLSDGIAMAITGKLSGRAAKKVQKIVLSKQRKLLEFWNMHTDGLKVDLDKFFGQIEY